MDGGSRKRIANSITIAMGPICFVGLAVTSRAKPAPPPRIDPDGDNPLQDLCSAVFDTASCLSEFATTSAPAGDKMANCRRRNEHDTIDAIENEDWHRIADRWKIQKWYDQVGDRGAFDVNVLRSGEDATSYL